MPYVQLNGSEIFYIDEGDGFPLVFVHGIAGSYRMFIPQIEYFRKNFRVIAIDLRGNGCSGRLTGPISTILDQQSGDLARLMDHLNIEQALVCGTSYGGMLCLHFGIRFPKRVLGLVITDGFSDVKAKGLFEGILYLVNLLTLWMSYLPKTWMGPILSWFYGRWPLAQQYVSEVVENLRKHELLLQRILLLRVNLTKELPKISCPVLGIVGDNFLPYRQRMKRAMELIPQATLEIVENSIDPTNLCQPQRFNALVKRFIVQLSK